MSGADSLLRNCSWHAENLLRQRGHFNTVVFVAQYADGARRRFERSCNNAQPQPPTPTC
jgi:hypothetical protein